MSTTLITNGTVKTYGWYSHAFHVPQSVLYDTSFNFKISDYDSSYPFSNYAKTFLMKITYSGINNNQYFALYFFFDGAVNSSHRFYKICSHPDANPLVNSDGNGSIRLYFDLSLNGYPSTTFNVTLTQIGPQVPTT